MSAPLPPMAPDQNRFDPPVPWYRRFNWAVFVIVALVAAVTDWLDLGWILAAVIAAAVCALWETLLLARRRRRPSGPA